jgi:predicted nucleotidyltransferase
MENNSENTKLDKFISLIVSTVSPEKIILFGSRARGDYNQDSDYDILVIMKHIEKKRNLLYSLYEVLLPAALPHSVDILATTSDRYDELKTAVGYIYKTIAAEGKVIYEQQP